MLSSELKSFITRIVTAVAIIFMLYGVFSIIDQATTYGEQYAVGFYLWVVFRFIVAIAVFYIGRLLYLMSKRYSSTNGRGFANVSLILVVLLTMSLTVPFLSETLFQTVLPVEAKIHPDFKSHLDRLEATGHTRRYSLIILTQRPLSPAPTSREFNRVIGQFLIHHYDALNIGIGTDGLVASIPIPLINDVLSFMAKLRLFQQHE
jgi:hypothetical protein